MKLFHSSLAVAGALMLVLPAADWAERGTRDVQYTYREQVGGPQSSPFGCDPGTSCGTASLSFFGPSGEQEVVFNQCGLGCHVRTIDFDDGSSLVMHVVDQPSPFAFGAPGNAGHSGYIGYPNLDGNPQFLSIIEIIVDGTGRFEGATGTSEGTVRLHGGSAIGSLKGTITVP